jgi:PmbA protein
MQMNDSGMLTQSLPDRDAELEMLRECVEAALDTAQRGGAEGAEVNASSQAGLSVAVRLGEIETLEHHRDRGIGISVYLGKRKGSASSADLRPDAIRDCVQNALDIARYTEEDACNGLPDPDRLATEFPDLDLWHPRTLDVGAAIARALECEAAGRADPRISNSEGASVNIHAGLSVQGNSAGFVGFNSGTRYDQSCVLVAGDGENMQRDYWYDSRRCFEDLEAARVTDGRARPDRSPGQRC